MSTMCVFGKTGGGPNKDDWVDVRCRTAIASVIWDRLREDPLAMGQRRYCRRCPTRYKMSFGV
eukprot:10515725-Lingulodinium_polyedra.AAC.1